MNLWPKMTRSKIYMKVFHYEDFTENKINAITKQVSRAGDTCEWIAIDNVASRGSYVCFSNLAMKGWPECPDLEWELLEGLGNIRVPEGPFHPFHGSRGWKRGVTDPRVTDKDQYDNVAYVDDKNFDEVYFEAECIAQGIEVEETTTFRTWRHTSASPKILLLTPESDEQMLAVAKASGMIIKKQFLEYLNVDIGAGGAT